MLVVDKVSRKSKIAKASERRAFYASDAVWGSDSWAGHGFMDGETGEVWLSVDMPNRRLADVAAHETLHALKHRNRSISVETEREAYAFGQRVAYQWALSDNHHAELFVVKTQADLPWNAFPGSSAFVRDEMAVYRASHRGTMRSPRWVEHRRVAKDTRHIVTGKRCIQRTDERTKH